MTKLKSIVVFKPMETAVFEVGEKIRRGDVETEVIVEKITVNFLGHVKISLSDGKAIYFENCPITYEK